MANDMAGTTEVMTSPDEAAVGAFRAQLKGLLLRPGDDDYDETRRVWNGMIDKHPAMIVRCTGVADVKAAVKFARRYGLTRGSAWRGTQLCRSFDL